MTKAIINLLAILHFNWKLWILMNVHLTNFLFSDSLKTKIPFSKSAKDINLRPLKGRDQCCTLVFVCSTNILKIPIFSHLPQAMFIEGLPLACGTPGRCLLWGSSLVVIINLFIYLTNSCLYRFFCCFTKWLKQGHQDSSLRLSGSAQCFYFYLLCIEHCCLIDY